MAKKKATRKANDTVQENHPHCQNLDKQDQKQTQSTTQEKTQTLARQPSMEDASEKLQNLKNLNSLLLKETLEKRQQVESLVHSKAALEAELSRSGVEKSELESMLILESDKNVCLEMEEGLFRFLVRTQMREMGVGSDREKSKIEDQIRALKSKVSGLMANLESERDRLSQVYGERDLIKSDLDCQVKEANVFKERLFAMEKRERDFKDEVLMLKSENEGLVKEKNMRERDLEVVRKERALVERRLVETLKEIDDLKGEIERIAREKKDIERETSEQKTKVNGLEKEVAKLNEIVLDLQEEEKVLRHKVLELEKSYSEAMEKGDEMVLEINILSGEKNEKQRIMEKLMEEKEDVSQRLEKAALELKDMERQIEKLLREKNEIAEMKVRQESDITELHKEIDELRGAVSTLKEVCRDEELKNKELVSEVTGYKNDLDRVKLERDDCQKGLDVEKKNGMLLKSKVSEMEKKIKEKVEELAKLQNEHHNLVEEKKKLEDHFELLINEKASVQKNLLKAQRGVDDLKAKMETLGIKSDRALNMLKSTAALVCQSKDEVDRKDEVVIREKKLDDVADPYAAELEVIREAFRNKEKLVEDMKQQVEFMKNSMEEAHKKKSFWTVVSSATTLFAAASVAYVARVR